MQKCKLKENLYHNYEETRSKTYYIVTWSLQGFFKSERFIKGVVKYLIAWSLTVIIPGLKKPYLKTKDFSSFRPISNLKFAAEAIEKVVAFQTCQYIRKWLKGVIPICL